jgi:hypothetical protein
MSAHPSGVAPPGLGQAVPRALPDRITSRPSLADLDYRVVADRPSAKLERAGARTMACGTHPGLGPPEEGGDGSPTAARVQLTARRRS